MSSSPETLLQSNPEGVAFLRTELDLASSFLDVATTTSRAEGRARGIRDALTAYRSILHFLPRFQLTPEGSAEFDQRIGSLRARLIAFGVDPSASGD